MKRFTAGLGVAVAFSLFAGTARAGDTVFIDEGWYRVEGSEPTPVVSPLPSLSD